MIPDLAIETRGLTKVYRTRDGAGKRALNSVDLEVPRGAIFGLLGPNGAGKSTMINILAGLVIKTAGTARVWGHDIEADMRAARTAIGIVPQELNIDAFFTPREVLDTQAGLYAVPKSERRTMELLTAMALEEKADSTARSLSGGMRRRLLVAKALVHSPPVVVLDEPTAGVDVELRQHLWSYMRELNARGTTIVLTTHYLEEAEELCDRIAIIDKGNVVACDTTEALLARLDQKDLTVTLSTDLDILPDALAALAPEQIAADKLIFHFRPSVMDAGEILEALASAGLHVRDLSTQEADLEDIFLRLTGNDGEAPSPPPDPLSETVTRSPPNP